MLKKSIFVSASMAMLATATSSVGQPGDQVGRAEAVNYLETPEGAKPRIVITADPELDDLNSMIRYVLYSTDFKTEGLIYASSRFHWKGDGKGTTQNLPDREYNKFGLAKCPCTSYRWSSDERFIDDVVEAYEKVYANLRVHHRDYPTPDFLKSKIRLGNVEFDGEMSKDTAGSNLIKSLLLDDVKAPIYLQAWGGQSTIARALKSIEDQYSGTPQWATVRAKVVSKAIISASGDQDDTYGKYIKPKWPDIRYTRNMGGFSLGYTAQDAASPEDKRYLDAAWTNANVTARGPLGSLYRIWGDGKIMVPGDRSEYYHLRGETVESLKKQGYIVAFNPQKEGSFLAEGDTGNFLNLLDNGLRGYREDSPGGWGGYKVRDISVFESRMRMFSQMPATLKLPFEVRRGPTHPFLAPAQRDFAARLKWSVTPVYRDANHNPSIVVKPGLAISAQPGQRLKLRALVSDPDGNRVTVKWWNWKEAGTHSGSVPIVAAEGVTTEVRVPHEAKPGDQLQIIAEATDDGVPALTRYAKVVLTIR